MRCCGADSGCGPERRPDSWLAGWYDLQLSMSILDGRYSFCLYGYAEQADGTSTQAIWVVVEGNVGLRSDVANGLGVWKMDDAKGMSDFAIATGRGSRSVSIVYCRISSPCATGLPCRISLTFRS